MAKEPISQTCMVDGKQVKLTREQVTKLQADVDGPKRFYTDAWLKDYLARFRVVKECEACGEPLVAEEVDSHGMKHVLPRLRPIMRMYLDLDPTDREAVRDFVAAAG